jgi:purine-nucleoside phosphorylase
VAALDDFTAAVRAMQPAIAVVLGSGQSNVLSGMREESSIRFADVPTLARPTVAGHSGKIVVGQLGNKPLLVFQGRTHFYEGHPWEKVTAPIRFAASLGIKTLLLTNAAGGLHPALDPGSMMILRDHLFWQTPGSWKGPGPAICGCIAGDRPSPYSPPLIDALRTAGQLVGEHLIDGIYAALTGPCYETPAEIRALQRCGADAVGMSTAYEIEIGTLLGLECAALSGITNKAAGLSNQTLDHHDVLEVMSTLGERMGRLISQFIRLVGTVTR